MIEQYFKTGKTIVIDDKYKEAEPLLEALTKLHIPFVYTQGKPASDYPLPKNPKHYNLVFVDLNLDLISAGSMTDGDEKTFKSTHINIMDRVIRNTNSSFLLVIWSLEEHNYKDVFLKIFDKEEKYKTKKKPYKILSLSKADFFEHDKDGKFVFKDEMKEELFNKIEQELSGIEAFKFFCEWDRVISQSTGDTIDDIMALINDFRNEDRESKLSEILTAISIAYSGNHGFLKLKNDQEKTDSVLLALTQLLMDDIDKNVLLERQEEYCSWKKVANNKEIKDLISNINKNSINTKLLSYKPNRIDLTGSVYKVNPEDLNSIEIFEYFFNGYDQNGHISKNCKTAIKEMFSHEAPDKEFDEDVFNDFKTYIKDRVIPIEVNITPLCDIVQGKAPIQRKVMGYLIPSFFEKVFNFKYDHKYLSPDFFININKFNLSYFLLLDYRYSLSYKVSELKEEDYLFTLRSSLINDIQTKYAAHISRLGFLYL